MRKDEKKRQKAYWEIAAAMATLGYHRLGPGDVEAVHQQVLAGGVPTGAVGRQIATALENYFNADGGALTPPGDDDSADGTGAGEEPSA